MSATENRRVRPGVELLEARQLMSVTVLPGHINLKSVNHGNGGLTVRVLGDTTAGQALVSSTTALVYSILDPSGIVHQLGSPLRMQSAAEGGSGALVVKFRRSSLRGLAAGELTLQVTTQDG